MHHHHYLCVYITRAFKRQYSCVYIYERERCVCFCGENANEKRNERERELFFEDLNFFFVFLLFFSLSFFHQQPRKSFSPFLAFSFHFFHQKNDESLIKKRRPNFFLITVSPIFPNHHHHHHHHALSWSSSLSSSSGVLLRAFGVFTRGGRAKNNDA